MAGLVANIFASASEKADTRSWTTLPDKMHMARMRLPAGVHHVVVDVLDGQGTVRQTATFDQVLIKAGEATIIRHRSFR